MISKSQQNMAILDENNLKLTKNMNEMPKNLSLEKSNCDNSSHLSNQMPSLAEDSLSLKDHLSENKKNKNFNDKTETESNEIQNATRIQLSFSVDRLLNNKLQQQNISHPPLCTQSPKDDNHLETKVSDKCCDDLKSGYSCCLLPNCLVSSTTATYRNVSLHGNTFPRVDEDDMTPTFLDFKSIVRPTPVRAMGNATESVSNLTQSLSTLPTTSIIRFHHAHLQQQKQMAQHLPVQPNFTLSSLINPLCNLKPLQLGIQNFNTPTTANRFNTKVNFDIPLVRPNLTCFPTLRHQPQLTPPNTNETHINFSTAPISTSATNTVTANSTSTPNHGSLNSGKRKRSWSRAVFSNLQRKGLEIQFQQQKYITKPDRRKLAARLNLTDAQVKVWFQNRRMKWRHTRENLKSGQEKQPGESSSTEILKTNPDNTVGNDLPGYSSDGSSSIEMSDADEDDNEIDVVE